MKINGKIIILQNKKLIKKKDILNKNFQNLMY
jgi:hypothetical protein